MSMKCYNLIFICLLFLDGVDFVLLFWDVVWFFWWLFMVLYFYMFILSYIKYKFIDYI